jgi:hypothetical protein
MTAGAAHGMLQQPPPFCEGCSSCHNAKGVQEDFSIFVAAVYDRRILLPSSVILRRAKLVLAQSKDKFSREH